MRTKYENDKNCRSKSHIFTSLPNKAFDITKEKAINHECVMVTKSILLCLQDFTRIINNYAYSGRLLK